MIHVAPRAPVGQSGLDAFGVDSLMMIEVVLGIDSAFGILIPQENLPSPLIIEFYLIPFTSTAVRPRFAGLLMSLRFHLN